MNQRVLIITYYWPPSGGAGVQRFLKFSRYLPRFDVDPIVLTVENPTYPIIDSSLADNVPEKVRVHHSKTVEPFSLYARLRGEEANEIKPTVELKGTNPLSRMGSWIRANLFIPDARVGWYLTARRKATKLIQEYGITTVITTGPPHSVHLIGRALKRELNISWIADFRDPWTTVYYNQMLPRTGLADEIDRSLEKSVLNEADRVIVVTPSQAEELRTITDRAIHVITNGFDPDDFAGIPQGPPATPPVIIRHIGSVGEASLPDSFLMAFKEVSESAELVLEFIGHVHQQLPERAEKLGLGNIIRFREYLPHREAIEEMCRAHILLLIIPQVGEIRHHIPGKLFEYLGSGRPVILVSPPSASDGDSERILAESGAGITCRSDDPAGIRKTLMQITNSIQDRKTEPRPGRPATDPNHPYSRLKLTGDLAAIIRELNNDS